MTSQHVSSVMCSCLISLPSALFIGGCGSKEYANVGNKSEEQMYESRWQKYIKYDTACSLSECCEDYIFYRAKIIEAHSRRDKARADEYRQDFSKSTHG